MKAGMNAYIWWYIRRFYGPIDDDGRVTKRGWVMAQYARFVRPGSVRVSATSTPQPDVYVTAYKHQTKAVIVVINFSSATVDQLFLIKGGTVSAFSRYTTSESKSCLSEGPIPVTNGRMTAVLEPQSITTLVSE